MYLGKRNIKSPKLYRNDRALFQPQPTTEFIRLNPHAAYLYARVTDVNRPNYQGARIPVNTHQGTTFSVGIFVRKIGMTAYINKIRKIY